MPVRRSVSVCCAAALTLLGAAALAAQAPANDTMRIAEATRTGTAGLNGVVRDSLGRPLAGAVVSAAQLQRITLTDSAGRFHLGGLPADTVAVFVRRVGYAPAEFEIGLLADATISVAVKMLPSLARLGTIVVRGERRSLALGRNGFYERERRGRGFHLSGEKLERYGALPVASVLRNVPRVRVQCRMGRCVPLMPSAGRAGVMCAPTVFLDGMRGDFDMLQSFGYADELAGLEVYRDPSEAPLRFSQPFAECGAIVAWTKCGAGERGNRTPGG